MHVEIKNTTRSSLVKLIIDFRPLKFGSELYLDAGDRLQT